MNIAECSYCGMLSLIKNNVCQNCRTAIGADDNSTQANVFVSPENQPPKIYHQENFSPPAQSVYRLQQQHRTQVTCWKCNAVNIWEETKICRQCGCYLKVVNLGDQRKAQNESAKFQWFVGVFVFSFVLIFGTVGLIKLISYKPHLEQTGLPADCWYKPTFSNYFRGKPTIKEIIEKNNSVVSLTIKPSDVKTLSFQGNISFALGKCATAECLLKKNKIKAEIKAEKDAAARKAGYASAPGNESPPETLDNSEYFDNQSYIELGRVESFEKKPDKFLRKSFMYRIKGSEKKDILEGLNAEKGWSKKTIYARDGKINNSIEDIVGDELAKLKSSTTSRWQSIYEEFELTDLGIQSLNDQKEFVLQKRDGEKVEKLYFNAVSGNLDKVEDSKMTGYLSLYQDFNGIRLPNKLCYKSLSEDETVIWLKIENIEWHLNEPIDDAVFEKPTE